MVYNKELNDSTEAKKLIHQIKEEILKCLIHVGENISIKVILSSFLLFRCCGRKNELSYQELLNGDLELPKDVLIAVKEQLSKAEWQALQPLLKKYTADDFFLTCRMLPFSFHDKRSLDVETPDSLISLAEEILSIQPGESVADICCGAGRFLTDAAEKTPDASFFGYEKEPMHKTVAVIRGELVGKNVHILLQDTFALPVEDPPLRFQKIFSVCPFNSKAKEIAGGTAIPAQLVEKMPDFLETVSPEWLFIALLCNLLDPKGKAVAIVFKNSLWNRRDTAVRNYFVEQGLIESVIMLPPKMFESTIIPAAMIVLSHGNSGVRLIDATAFCRQKRWHNIFSEEDIRKITDAFSKDSDCSKSVSPEEMRKTDYSLLFNRYFTGYTPPKDAVPFGSVIKNISRGISLSASKLDELSSETVTKFRYLMLTNIRNGVIERDLPYLSHIGPQQEKYCLKNNCLLITKNGPFKIAVASVSNEEKILASGNLYIIELDETKVDPYFLKAFLESDLGSAALKSIIVGDAIPSISVDSLKKLKVPIPSMEKQLYVAQEYRKTLSVISAYKEKLEQAFNRLQHIYDESLKM